MTYKNHEGYPDPTQGNALNGVRKEERQKMLEKKYGLKRGQKITITEISRDEMYKPAKKKEKIYTVIELYKHCVLLKDENGFCTAHSYIQLQSLMRGGD